MAKKHSKTSLEPFWVESPDLWFAYAEAVFDHRQVNEDHTKNSLVLNALARTLAFQDENAKDVFEWFDAQKLSVLPYPMFKSRVRQSFELHFRKSDKNQLMNISPDELTGGSVAKLVKGAWNPHESFRVQVVEMPPENASTTTKTDFLFIRITDGVNVAIVKVASQESKQLQYHFGKTTTYPVVKVSDCQCEFLDDISLLREVPGT